MDKFKVGDVVKITIEGYPVSAIATVIQSTGDVYKYHVRLNTGLNEHFPRGDIFPCDDHEMELIDENLATALFGGVI